MIMWIAYGIFVIALIASNVYSYYNGYNSGYYASLEDYNLLPVGGEDDE